MLYEWNRCDGAFECDDLDDEGDEWVDAECAGKQLMWSVTDFPIVVAVVVAGIRRNLSKLRWH